MAAVSASVRPHRTGLGLLPRGLQRVLESARQQVCADPKWRRLRALPSGRGPAYGVACAPGPRRAADDSVCGPAVRAEGHRPADRRLPHVEAAGRAGGGGSVRAVRQDTDRHARCPGPGSRRHLSDLKGTDLLIAAYRMLKRPAALVVAGPCERFGKTQIGTLVAQVQEAGGIYLPPLDDADMPGIYNACDIFVMPTRELEMFGMAAVEAQACGKPVV